MSADWLSGIVIVNESRDLGRADDVSIFRSAGEACRYLEHWWVEDGEGFVFTATGIRLHLGVDNRTEVKIVSQEHVANGTDIVRGWLRTAAERRLAARRAQAARNKAVLTDQERAGRLPESIEGLIAYVGFQP